MKTGRHSKIRRLVFNHFRFPFSPVLFARRFRRGLQGMGRLWPVGPIAGAVMARNTFSCIPVGESVELPPGTVAPLSIVESFVGQASRRVIMNHCFCRNSSGCADHDPAIGCLFLGEGTRQLDPSMGREVSEEEALAHVRRAVDNGLVPCIGQAWVDARAFGVKDYRHFMTVCFCCSCCCLFGVLPHVPEEAMHIVVKLEGANVVVGEECDGCGKCLEACLFSQLSLQGGRALIGDDCKACGRCAAACPARAIRIRLDDPAYVDRCLERLGARVEVRDQPRRSF